MHTNKINDKVVQFLITEMGGEQEVMNHYYSSSIASLNTSDTKLGDLIDQAMSEGWIDWLRQKSMKELMSLIDGSSHGRSKTTSSVTSRKQAMHEASELRNNILSFLYHSPSSRAKDIRTATGGDSLKITIALRTLRNKGLIELKGTGRNSTYSLSTER